MSEHRADPESFECVVCERMSAQLCALRAVLLYPPAGSSDVEVLGAARAVLRMHAERDEAAGEGAEPAGLAEDYQRRYGESLPDVDEELRSNPIGPDVLASNEQWAYYLIERVVHRHAFTDHDCQTVGCQAMHLWCSPEMTRLLADAYERGVASVQREGAEPATCAANGCRNRATGTRASYVPGWPDEPDCGLHAAGGRSEETSE